MREPVAVRRRAMQNEVTGGGRCDAVTTGGVTVSSAEQPNASMRTELAQIVASVRAYIEWHQDSGSLGFERPTRRSAPASFPTVPPAAAVAQAPVSPASPEAPASLASDEASPKPPRNLPPVQHAAAHSALASSTAPASAPRSLKVVHDDVQTCAKCTLSNTRTHVAFAQGNPGARLMLVGDVPAGADTGEHASFSAASKQLIDKIIVAMGLRPDEDVYLTTVIKCGLPVGRDPSASDQSTCVQYTHEQIASVRPQVLVALGHHAASALVGSRLGMASARGQWKLYAGTTPMMVTHAVSDLLQPGPRQAERKKQAWADFQAVMRELGIATAKR